MAYTPKVNHTRLLEHFLRYIAIDTQVNPAVSTSPSSEGQRTLGALLCKQLQELGAIQPIHTPEGYVYAHIEGRDYTKHTPRIAFIAHLDTAPDAPGCPHPPAVINPYKGGDITLSKGKVIEVDTFPALKKYKGQTLIVGDGTALLGADDKAGITAIIEAITVLLHESSLPFAPLAIAFTTDEELGRGADHINLEHLNAQLAYTIDGGELGELQYENFHAAEVIVTLHGISVHTGSAFHTMRNALNMAHTFHALLPPTQRPELTQDRQGFFHLYQLQGDVTQTSMQYIIRDHDALLYNQKINTIRSVAQQLNQLYNEECITVQVHEQYRNMIEVMEQHPAVINLARDAMHSLGITPLEHPIRGGTDGARLSFQGLPCPNLFAGGHNFHGPYEFLPLPSLAMAAQVIIQIAHLATKL